MRLNDVSKKHYEWLKSMGWVGVATPLEQVALIMSELGECANECRGEEPTENLRLELADVILRVLGLSERLGIDMEKAIEEKMEINSKRKKTKNRIK